MPGVRRADGVIIGDMSARLKVSIGDVFGRLTVLDVTVNRKTILRCLCVCGSVIVRPASYVVSGDTRSCGCLHHERSIESAKIHAVHHGHTKQGSRTPEYVAWQAMKRRCGPKWHKRNLYFDRGIDVCREWAGDFQSFLLAVGPRPGPSYSLDRIDNSKGYYPGFPFSPAPDGPLIHAKAAAPTRIVFIAQSSRF